MYEETNDSPLKDKIESQLITRSFNASGMPLVVWEEVNLFCRDNYGDVRWVMVKDLMDKARADFKYALLYEEIAMLKQELAEIKAKASEPKPVTNRFKTFGMVSDNGG